jgi:beta-lactamase class A
MVLDELDAIRGTISIWQGPVGGPPTLVRHPDATHYAASTMKLAVLVALFRAAERGDVDLGSEVVVRNEFTSVLPGGGEFAIDFEDDNDPLMRLGEVVTLRWLAERMIVRSSNIATNVLIGIVGTDAVNRVWRDVGATHSVTGRGIEDAAAREAGISNLVTAADLAALVSAIALGTAARAESCAEMMRILEAQEYRDDLPRGLPPGTRVACKNGWVTGVRHCAAVVFPAGAPAYTLVVCSTTDLGEADGADLLARIAAVTYPE